ncbi:MAG: HAD-IIIA family hydrolase [Bacteroidia bacterium]|nr:HAD-IIIA family hydrolase [Bacteroidia bacterium]
MNWSELQVDKEWSLFLDRDGTINKKIDDGYVTKWEEFEFLPGVLDALAECSEIFNRIVVVTNQQGVGKKLMKEAELKHIHEKMLAEIQSAGGRIDHVFYCKELADKEVNCRKPKTFMGYRARDKFRDIDFKKSIMIGDSWSDMRFGKNLYMTTVGISEGNLGLADFNYPSLKEFSSSLLQTM